MSDPKPPVDPPLVSAGQDAPPEPQLRAPAVAFPDHSDIQEEKSAPRPKGVEMKRELTREDRELAAAGYEHLDPSAQGKEKGGLATAHVDITEHSLPLAELEAALESSFDAKDPSASSGLTEAEAKKRLERDGRNVLTPPKRRSALQKVGRVWLCDVQI